MVGFKKILGCGVGFFCLLLAHSHALRADPSQPPASRPIRFMLPGGPFTLAAEKEMAGIVAEFNRTHPKEQVEIVRRGENFSSLKDLITSNLAGILPDLGTVEISEVPVLEDLKLLVPLDTGRALPLLRGMSPELLKQARDSHGNIRSIPFERVAPVLFMNEELLFRAHLNKSRSRPVQTWKGLIELAGKLTQGADPKIPTQSQNPSQALALPLLGAHGLWMFEAIANKPLWVIKRGGVQANRELLPIIRELQKLIDQPKLSASEETQERAVQNFLERRTALLAASTEALPYIAARSQFRWTAVPLPKFSGGLTDLGEGTQIVVLKNTPGIWNFLNYLYSPGIATKWVSAAGYLPLRSDWKTHPQWKELTQPLGPYPGLVKSLNMKRNRTGGPNVVQLRTEWVRILPALFGDSSKRPPVEEVFTRLDVMLTNVSRAKGL